MSMKLVILGLLLERDMHPYEIAIVMKERSLHRITKLQTGSLYYAVDRLAESGHIKPVEVIASSDRPDKTVYAITPAGKTLFEQLILSQFRKTDPVHPPLYLALALSQHVDQDKIASLLEERIREAAHEVNISYQIYEEHIGIIPRSSLYLIYGKYEHARTELRWLKALYRDVKDGRLQERGNPIDY